jgi:hypothetical protein
MSVPGRFTYQLINCQAETSTFNAEMFFSVMISCSGDQGSNLSAEPIAGFDAKAKLTG